MPADAFDGGHYVVVVGMSDQYVYVHDPYRGGAHLRLLKSEFDNALKETVSVGAAVYPYQGIILTDAA